MTLPASLSLGGTPRAMTANQQAHCGRSEAAGPAQYSRGSTSFTRSSQPWCMGAGKVFEIPWRWQDVGPPSGQWAARTVQSGKASPSPCCRRQRMHVDAWRLTDVQTGRVTERHVVACEHHSLPKEPRWLALPLASPSLFLPSTQFLCLPLWWVWNGSHRCHVNSQD